ncbi:Glutathione S-transferase [Macleaya cordata]|uniref:glutathione transferase n=1 Tax=Macleaya cordata TaxID=56857 RepID=A0A200QWL9_MACCD|nr:Glutathione S-transferase [Macleaya cordata]
MHFFFGYLIFVPASQYNFQPFGKIPALEDDELNLTLFESRAITKYLDLKFRGRGPNLTRIENEREAALVAVWVEVESQQFHPPVSKIINHFFNRVHEVPLNQALIDENLEILGGVLNVYEDRLNTTRYLACNCYTLADLHHLPYMYCLMRSPYWADLINPRPRVKAWWEDISSRPAFVQVAPGMAPGV